jgi:glucose/arabinose dehydrogenase
MKSKYFQSLLCGLFLSGLCGNATEKHSSLAKSGNYKPSIVQLTAAEEAAVLKKGGVSVPEGFEATLFAPWQAANYPVYVAASPGGDLYVSSDGCGSLGRDAGRGRVLRLRDKDGDGRADEVTEFIPSINSPRGLIWDHDRLYLLHPPHVSVFFDRDGDGVAEESKRLVSNIAFGFKDRPADHTTNGLDLGVDGWMSKQSDLMGGHYRTEEVGCTVFVRMVPAWNYFLMVPEIFSLYPLVHCSIYLVGIIPMTGEDGMYDFTTLVDWMIMGIPVCI